MFLVLDKHNVERICSWFPFGRTRREGREGIEGGEARNTKKAALAC